MLGDVLWSQKADNMKHTSNFWSREPISCKLKRALTKAFVWGLVGYSLVLFILSPSMNISRNMMNLSSGFMMCLIIWHFTSCSYGRIANILNTRCALTQLICVHLCSIWLSFSSQQRLKSCVPEWQYHCCLIVKSSWDETNTWSSISKRNKKAGKTTKL